VGEDHRHFSVKDLTEVAEPLAAVTLELPLRRSGFQALGWDELTAIAVWARDNHVPFHLDGARLWEVQPWYARPLAEIAALADSVYVSLYKGLGGIAGCVLAGTTPLIAACKPWRVRYGADLPLAFPMIVTALDGLESTLPRMPDYCSQAIALAKAIDDAPGLTVFPKPPHCNSFQVHFAAPAEAMEQVAFALAQETGTWLFSRFEQGLLPRTCFGEVTIGEASMDWTPAEAAETLARLSHRAVERQVS
jgi:threonine aldolase